MRLYESSLKTGDKLYYNGKTIEWVNPATGKTVEKMTAGKYIITAVTSKFFYLKSDRKNATTEHKIYKDELENHVKIVEFSDITNTAGLIFMNLNPPTWILNDDNFQKTLASAKKFNKR